MIIGFGYKSRVGKDTAAKFFLQEFRIRPELRNKYKNCQHKMFAWKLKQMCYELYAWAGVKEPIYYENNPEERYKIIPTLGCHVVDLWIKFGNCIRENVCPETWCNYLLYVSTGCDGLFISDLRFPNEAEAIKKKGGILVNIKNSRGKENKSDKFLDNYTGWDYEIENEGTLNEYYGKLENLLQQITANRQ